MCFSSSTETTWLLLWRKSLNSTSGVGGPQKGAALSTSRAEALCRDSTASRIMRPPFERLQCSAVMNGHWAERKRRTSEIEAFLMIAKSLSATNHLKGNYASQEREHYMYGPMSTEQTTWVHIMDLNQLLFSPFKYEEVEKLTCVCQYIRCVNSSIKNKFMNIRTVLSGTVYSSKAFTGEQCLE